MHLTESLIVHLRHGIALRRLPSQDAAMQLRILDMPAVRADAAAPHRVKSAWDGKQTISNRFAGKQSQKAAGW